MQPIIDSFADRPELFIGLVLGSFGIVACVLIIWMLSAIAIRNGREQSQTRRELAAFVAEGSMTPEDAERLLQPHPWYAKMEWFSGSKANKNSQS